MRKAFPDRFEPVQILKQEKGKTTAICIDHLLGLPEVVVKLFRRGHFQGNRDSILHGFSWHRTIEHPNIASVLEAGLTPREDLYSLRPYYEAAVQRPHPMALAEQLV